VYQLFAVDEHSGFIVLIQLKSKHLTAINYAFCELIAHYKKYRWNISKITCDSESVLRAAKTYLSHQGIILGHTPPHQHAQRAERYIRTLKDRVRTILSAMRFVLPYKLDMEIYKAAAIFINEMPSKHEGNTPTMLVEGRKLNLGQRHVTTVGTVIMIHTPSTKDAIPRSDLGILIGPSDCTYNAMQCYNIGSDAIMIRHHYTILKHIPTAFPYPLHNLPTTPSAMVKRILKEKNPKDIIDKDSQESNQMTYHY
jgi:hypothetical protein